MAQSRPAVMAHSDVPFCCLGPSTKQLLSMRMDPPRPVLSPTTVRLQDWRGLAELFGFSQIDVDNFERRNSPTIEILSVWSRLSPQATVGDVLQALLELERYDILHCPEFQRAIDRDVARYRTHLASIQARQPDPIQVPNVDSTYNEDQPMIVGEVETGRRVYFDAFVCYTAADAPFVHNDLIYHLENVHGLRLFIPERDMVVGGANYVMLAELIKSRCNKMVIVLSPDYHNSEECKFLTRFAQSLQPGADKRTLIPIIYRPCMIPDILRFIAVLDYNREDAKPWLWQRLASSLRTAQPQSAILHPFPVGPGYPLPELFDYPAAAGMAVEPASVATSAAAADSVGAGLPTSRHHVHTEIMPVSSPSVQVESSETSSTSRSRTYRHHSLPTRDAVTSLQDQEEAVTLVTDQSVAG